MKKYIIPILLLTFSLTACESYLDIEQKGVVSMESFYQTDEDAESALIAAYQTAMYGIVRNSAFIYSPYTAILNYCGDDMYAAGSFFGDNDYLAQLNEFRYDVNNEVINNMYRGFYKAIYGCNLVINNFEYGESSIKDRCISEARVMRAFCHMMLAILWDNPPKVDEVLEGSARPANCDHDELLQWCAAECEEAAAYLDERQSTSDKDGSVKITKGAAYAFAGKALLFKNDYAGAKTQLAKVINSGKYALVPGSELAAMFHYEGDGNAEKVFEFNQVYNSNISTWGGSIQRSTWMMANLWNWRNDKLGGMPNELFATGWGGCNPRGDFAEALIANDGMDSYRRKAWIRTYDEVLYDLTYPNDNVMTTREAKSKDPHRGLIDPVGLYGHEGYFHMKMVASRTDMINNSYSIKNFTLMRYAEVLLMYAECCAQLGDDGTGLKALNDVQVRAGANHISTSCTLEEVKNEKLYEMWLEGCRFADLVRWGEAATKLATSGDRVPSFKDPFCYAEGTAGKTATHTGVVDWSEAEHLNNVDHGFQSGKHEYFPFPFSEISINESLVQNPGW